MKSAQFLLLLALTFAVAVSGRLDAHEGDDHDHAPVKVPDDVTYGATGVPDRIVLSWEGDPATSQSVSWRTDESVKKAIAEIAEAEDGPNFIERARRIDAATQTLDAELGPANYHSAAFVDLAPQTKYAYRVGDGVNWSEWSHFTTASAEPAPFSFVYFGDSQNDLKSHWSRVVREAYRDAPRAAFLLHAGDLVNKANSDAEWGQWFYASGFIHRSTPCIATPGNHEYGKLLGGLAGRALSSHWRPTFAFPQNGPEGLLESVYWIDYQGARIISLNSNEQQDEQVAWLEQTLTDNPNKWTILTFHHPLFSAARGRDNKRLRELWQPVFDKHRVDLVLQGHDHTYARSKLMTFEENLDTGATQQSGEAGTMYVVSVSGPKMYNLGKRPFMRRGAEDTQLYQIIHVAGDELRYEARTAAGRLYDAFTLKKRDGQPNELIEQIPDTPERRRPASLGGGGE